MVTRRKLGLGVLGAALGLLGTTALTGRRSVAETPAETFPFALTEAEWRKRLTGPQFHVLREHGTEYPGSSPLDREKRRGVFHCAGCEKPLFASETKFDSGTGWPSFYQPLENAVGETQDRSLFMIRVEVHCANCGGHLGHVFDDGPPPTHLRYCMNGIAMTFKPTANA